MEQEKTFEEMCWLLKYKEISVGEFKTWLRKHDDKIKKDILQIVVEDVPHKYQDRLVIKLK